MSKRARLLLALCLTAITAILCAVSATLLACHCNPMASTSLALGAWVPLLIATALYQSAM